MKFSVYPNFCLILLLCLFSCTQEETNSSITTSGKNSEEIKLFEIVPATQSGIQFSNQVQDNLTINFFNFDAIYQGAGVAVGDINN